MPRPEILYGIELPAGSGIWHPIASKEIAEALMGTGYTVERYQREADLREHLIGMAHTEVQGREGVSREEAAAVFERFFILPEGSLLQEAPPDA